MQNRINIFTYGSLMFPIVMNRLVTEKYESKKGTLKGYKRRRLRYKSYPGIIAEPKQSVEGVLWFGINAKDTAYLDDFECQYDRTKVKITTEDGVTHDSYVYVYKTPSNMEQTLWDPQQFRKHNADTFAQGF